jgi:hypothetical protein
MPDDGFSGSRVAVVGPRDEKVPPRVVRLGLLPA